MLALVNLDCQLNGIYNDHGNKSLSVSVRDFLDLLRWKDLP